MTNSTTSVMGRSRLKAARPTKGTSAIRISSVPYAEEEIPSGDSTPSASGFVSRCSPRSWLTSGGPSSLRLVEYQNVSGRPALFSSKPAALRVATNDLRLSSGLYAFGGARDFLPLQPLWTVRAGRGDGRPWPIWERIP